MIYAVPTPTLSRSACRKSIGELDAPLPDASEILVVEDTVTIIEDQAVDTIGEVEDVMPGIVISDLPEQELPTSQEPDKVRIQICQSYRSEILQPDNIDL